MSGGTGGLRVGGNELLDVMGAGRITLELVL